MTTVDQKVEVGVLQGDVGLRGSQGNQGNQGLQGSPGLRGAPGNQIGPNLYKIYGKSEVITFSRDFSLEGEKIYRVSINGQKIASPMSTNEIMNLP